MSELSLRKLHGYTTLPGPVVVVVMDGVGIGRADAADAVHVAHTPELDRLYREPLFATLKAHGTAVGLPSDGDMGNSEVGHNIIGAGRVFDQGARLVNAAIASERIYSSAAWQRLIERSRAGGTVHFIGLVSDGNVHSHVDHLYALVERCAREGIGRLRVHGLLDGRDVGVKSALAYFAPLEEKLASLSQGERDYRIASGGGRMVTTMDRYGADWSVVERGWNAHVLGKARGFPSAVEAIRTYYEEDPSITDQYMDSFVVVEDGRPVGTIDDGDAIVLFNFRGDRAIEISRAFDEDDFSAFDRVRRPDVAFAGMMQYDGDTMVPKSYLVEPPVIDVTLSHYLCHAGVTSYAISETQKFGHVTYFWNGNNSGYVDEGLERYVEIPSDRLTFDLRPWMKAAQITDAVLAAIAAGAHRFVRINYANGDMVGHTGVAAATRVAVEVLDLSLGRLAAGLAKTGGVLLVTADHGNADLMWTEKDGKRAAHVAHTLNPVPFVVRDFSGSNRWDLAGVEAPGLANLAATICNLLGYEAPDGFDASLITLAGS